MQGPVFKPSTSTGQTAPTVLSLSLDSLASSLNIRHWFISVTYSCKTALGLPNHRRLKALTTGLVWLQA